MKTCAFVLVVGVVSSLPTHFQYAERSPASVFTYTYQHTHVPKGWDPNTKTIKHPSNSIPVEHDVLVRPPARFQELTNSGDTNENPDTSLGLTKLENSATASLSTAVNRGTSLDTPGLNVPKVELPKTFVSKTSFPNTQLSAGVPNAPSASVPSIAQTGRFSPVMNSIPSTSSVPSLDETLQRVMSIMGMLPIMMQMISSIVNGQVGPNIPAASQGLSNLQQNENSLNSIPSMPGFPDISKIIAQIPPGTPVGPETIQAAVQQHIASLTAPQETRQLTPEEKNMEKELIDIFS